jgi:hypothetical protein
MIDTKRVTEILKDKLNDKENSKNINRNSTKNLNINYPSQSRDSHYPKRKES